MAKPISPYEAAKQAKGRLQSRTEVIEAFNEMIVENWDDGQSFFSQDQVIERILLKFGNTIDRDAIFKSKWLDVEDLYRKQGWDVDYSKPGWGESGSARFIFTRKKKSND